MNIAFYIPVLNVGGAEKVIINLLKQLSQAPGEEYFLITDARHSSWINEVDNKITILNVNSEANIFYRFYGIIKAIKRNKIQIVISHLTHANIHCLFLRILFSFKLLIVEHSITSAYIDDIPKLKYVYKLLIKKLFKHADQIICVSQATKNDLIKHFKIPENKCKVIYNPFDFECIKLLSKMPISDEYLGKIKSRKFIVTIARLEIQKNHLFLIDALKNYLKLKDIVLIIIGDGSQKQIIENKIAESNLHNNIYLTGKLNNPYPFLLNADLLVHPARFEGFGLVLVEALFLSTKVVSMNFATAFEILGNGQLGIIVNDQETMIEAVISSIELEKNAQKINYSQNIIDRYNLEVIANSYRISINSKFV